MEFKDKSYDEVSGEGLEILTAFFMEEDIGQDNELMLDILSDRLGSDPEEFDDISEKIEALSEIVSRLTGLFSGMLIHVVNLIRIISMMGMRTDKDTYQNYVVYYHTLLKEYEHVDDEKSVIAYIEQLHTFFGVDDSDEDD
jgi:hypothetical protein